MSTTPTDISTDIHTGSTIIRASVIGITRLSVNPGRTFSDTAETGLAHVNMIRPEQGIRCAKSDTRTKLNRKARQSDDCMTALDRRRVRQWLLVEYTMGTQRSAIDAVTVALRDGSRCANVGVEFLLQQITRRGRAGDLALALVREFRACGQIGGAL